MRLLYFSPASNFSYHCNDFQLGIPSENFTSGWKSPYNQPLAGHLLENLHIFCSFKVLCVLTFTILKEEIDPSSQEHSITARRNKYLLIFKNSNIADVYPRYSWKLKDLNFLHKVACRIKANMNWTTKNLISSHYFSKTFKTSTLQEHKR